MGKAVTEIVRLALRIYKKLEIRKIALLKRGRCPSELLAAAAAAAAASRQHSVLLLPSISVVDDNLEQYQLNSMPVPQLHSR